jgi:chromate transporter
MSLQVTLSASDWLALLGHFMLLSLLSVGGAISTAPDMHRYLVSERQWLSDSQFSSSISLAQAAPGPNVLFVALIGWNVGINAAGGVGAGWLAWLYGGLGLAITLLGILLPSTILTLVASRWGHKNRELRTVRAFKTGMAPVAVALLLATGWILTTSHGTPLRNWPLWLIAIVSGLLLWRTRIHLLWLLGGGALLGGMGWL